jgi:predicted RNA-binding protein YlxR (DUF448 family)
MRPARVPRRTCAGCRRVAAKGELIRVVRSPDGRAGVDPSGVLPGRGAYVHRNAGCVAAAFERNRLARALRIPLEGARAASLRQDIEEGLRE